MSEQGSCHYIKPDWPAPDHIMAVQTLRHGGASQAPYESFNLACHVGDDPELVEKNRQRLSEELDLPTQPRWLEQIHGCEVSTSTHDETVPPKCDAGFSERPGEVCVVMTADCLPILLCNRQGTKVAAIHAGWRGLASGIIARVSSCFTARPADLLVWLGPAIGPQAFEVGQDVYTALLQRSPAHEQAFSRSQQTNTWYCDIYQLARQQFNSLGIQAVYGGQYCTYTEKTRFFSYRRDGQTGRMASLIWIKRIIRSMQV